MLNHILKDFGLTPNEIKVYILLLSLRAMAASALSVKTGIKRLTIYSVLCSLKEKGFITTFQKENVTYFNALELESLLNICENAIAHEKKKKNDILEFIKEIKEIKGESSIQKRPCVKFFEGTTGIKKAYEDALTADKEILSYSSLDFIDQSFLQRRKEKGIYMKCLAPKTAKTIEEKKKDANLSREIMFIKDASNINSEINIYNDKVLFISFEEKIGILIESRETAKTMRKIFALSWIFAKKGRN